MADLRTLPTFYVEGSRWPPAKFNEIALGSLAYDAAWQREHTDDPTGEHDTLRIAYAGAYVAHVGGGVYAAGPQSHIAAVVRLATAGEVQIKLDFGFRAAGKWGAIVWGTFIEAPDGDVPVELPTGKLVDTVQIRLAGGVDQSFYFLAFGVR